MKKIISTLLIVFSYLTNVAQSDTLYLYKNKKIACKINEINESEIKYKQISALDGPIYIINKSTVIKYSLSNGFTEMIIPDELSLEGEHKDILGKRQVIKISPFSFAFDHLSFSYEKVIKVGMNLDVEAGVISSNINHQTNVNIFGAGNYNTIFHSGFFLKPGVKFFLGQDFSVKGLKYAHPLKGRYLKLELVVSNVNYQDLSITYYSGSPWSNGPYTTKTETSDLKAVAYGGFVNYGRQFILGNILTLDYYVGIGFTGQSLTYTNPNFKVNPFNPNGYGNYYDGEYNFTANYHTLWRIPTIGLSFTAGFRLGYILPESKHKTATKPSEKLLNN